MINIQELKHFNNACDEFVLGKYILADMKISSILKLINDNEKLTNIVNSCLSDYDFNAELKKCAVSNEFESRLTLPVEDKEIIAFVYNLLYKFQSKTLNFYDFITKFFAEDTINEKAFIEFAKSVIIPFKTAINNIFTKRHILVETNDYQNNIYNKLMSTIKLILKSIDNYKLNMNQKEEFTMLLNSLYYASEKNDRKLVYSLMVGLDYFTKCTKRVRVCYLSLEECFEK